MSASVISPPESFNPALDMSIIKAAKNTTWTVCLISLVFIQAHWPSDHYPFIQYDKNNIKFGSPKALNHVFEKLYKLEKKKSGKVNILQIGDSHIQADISSNRVRQLFQADKRFPYNARGFLFPYRMAHTNNPENYSITYSGIWEGKMSSISKHWCQWGLAGICASTTNRYASFSINPNSRETLYDIHKVKIFFPTKDPTSYRVEVVPEAGNLVSSEMTGDGYMEFTLDQPQRQISIKVLKTSPKQTHFVLQGMSLESHEPGVIYSASGVNGAKVKSYMRCTDFDKNLKALKPDLIIISLGTNDAYYSDFKADDFKRNYKYMINKIKAALPNTSILITTPGDLYTKSRYKSIYPNRRIPIAHDVIIQVANETGIAVWDFYEVMGGQYSAKKWRLNKLYKSDYVHLSAKGYVIQGDLIHKALMDAYYLYSMNKK